MQFIDKTVGNKNKSPAVVLNSPLPLRNQCGLWLSAISLSVFVVSLSFYLLNHFIAGEPPTLLEPYVDIEIIESVDALPNDTQTNTPLVQEPAIKPLAFEPVNVPIEVNDGLQIDDVNLNLEVDIPIKSMTKAQQLWAQPSSQGMGLAHQDGSGQDYIGRKAQTKRVVTPVATRRPNIPLVAYENKVDGWVLLAFTVNVDGRVSDIQIMDAQPRGIFETQAIEALSQWRYAPFKKQRKRDPEPKPVRLSQKIKFEWSMYSYNMDNL